MHYVHHFFFCFITENQTQAGTYVVELSPHYSTILIFGDLYCSHLIFENNKKKQSNQIMNLSPLIFKFYLMLETQFHRLKRYLITKGQGKIPTYLTNTHLQTVYRNLLSCIATGILITTCYPYFNNLISIFLLH